MRIYGLKQKWMATSLLGAAISLCGCAPELNIITPDALHSQTSASSSSSSSAQSVVSQPAAVISPIVYVNFEAWKSDFILKAVYYGFERGFVEDVLRDVVVHERVIASDSKQPEFSKPTSSYILTSVTALRADTARTRLNANADIPAIETQYGVPKSILGGIWAMESDFGRIQGDIDVVTAYATLAYDGRRRAWAEDQLLQTLSILKDAKVSRDRLKGSWAGAMGQTQFLPENYIKLGVDADHDGRVDIWKSDSDALGSAANLLSKAGWRRDQAWAVEVIIPAGFDYYLSETQNQTPDWWAQKGVVRADGRGWSAQEKAELGVILLPSGAGGPAFLALPNHFVIRKYNNSTAYALAVGLIADGIEGRVVSKPWPVEPALSMAQRKGAQAALNQAGFSVGMVDGVIGVGTRSALRNWQKANGRIADGYLSAGLADELSGMLTMSAHPPEIATMKPIP